jgi:hypothetical protein
MPQCQTKGRSERPRLRLIEGGATLRRDARIESNLEALARIASLPLEEQTILKQPGHPRRAEIMTHVFGISEDSGGQEERARRLLAGESYFDDKSVVDPLLSRRIRQAQAKPSEPAKTSDAVFGLIFAFVIGLAVAKYVFGIDTNIWHYILR